MNNDSTLVASQPSLIHENSSNHNLSVNSLNSSITGVTSELSDSIDKPNDKNNQINNFSEYNSNNDKENFENDNIVNKDLKAGNETFNQSIISTSSLTSAYRSETNSIHSLNSRANSPKSLQFTLSFPSKKQNIAETCLLISHDHLNSEDKSFFKIERKNLMHLFSLIFNNLINNISSPTKTLNCHDNIYLYDFFCITELILKHGLKARKGIIFGKKELWTLIESIENVNPQIIEIVQNIRELPNVKSNSGRIKAFLRFAFVRKVFNEIITYLIGCKELLASFYEEGSFILSNEIYDFLDKTNHLKDFDFRWCAKDDQLDKFLNLIDLTNYLINNERVTQSFIYDSKISENQIKELIEEKEFYENKCKEFQNKVLFYHNRIKELEIESLFESEIIKNPSKIELLTKKFGEIFRVPVEKLESVEANLNKNSDVLSLQEDVATLKKQLEIELSNRISKDAALEYIEQDFLIKQDENKIMRHQIEEVKRINDIYAQKVNELIQLNSDLNNKISSLTNKNQQLVTNVTELQRSLVATEAKYSQLSINEKSLRKQSDELQDTNEQLKIKVLQEQEEKTNLKKKLDDNIERNSIVINELNIANHRANDYPSLKKKHDILKRRCLEYEQTCEEIGLKLANAQLEIENLKEQIIPYNDAIWKDDALVDNCEGCNVQFSIKLRKHHCRNCGGIFCQKCSDRKILLPADSKPCRVCDQCHKRLINRYND